MDKKEEKKVRTCCPECGSQNTYESDRLKQGYYFYCNHCGYEKWGKKD